jgi:hypothetical protein
VVAVAFVPVIARPPASNPAKRPAVAIVAAAVFLRRPLTTSGDGGWVGVFIALTPCI